MWLPYQSIASVKVCKQRPEQRNISRIPPHFKVPRRLSWLKPTTILSFFKYLIETINGEISS